MPAYTRCCRGVRGLPRRKVAHSDGTRSIWGRRWSTRLAFADPRGGSVRTNAAIVESRCITPSFLGRARHSIPSASTRCRRSESMNRLLIPSCAWRRDIRLSTMSANSPASSNAFEGHRSPRAGTAPAVARLRACLGDPSRAVSVSRYVRGGAKGGPRRDGRVKTLRATPKGPLGGRTRVPTTAVSGSRPAPTT